MALTMGRSGWVWMAAWIALVIITGYTFALLDWEWGIVRGALMIACLLAGVGLPRLRRGRAAVRIPPRLGTGLTVLAAGLFAYHVVVAVDWMDTTKRANIIKLDQGQTLYRTLHFFPEVNPYGRGVLLDPVYYIVLLSRHYHSGCLQFPIPPPGPEASAGAHEAWRKAILARATRFWWHYDRAAADELMPRIDPTSRCRAARVDFDTLGFKYGPVTIAAFVPWVALLDKPGVFFTQTLLFCAICALSWLVARRRSVGQTHAAHLVLALMLSVPLLRNNLLLTSALDATATTLSLLGLYLWLGKRHGLCAAALGLAVGAKLLPSLLYAPLLLAVPRRNWLLFAACAVLPYVPFVLWDWEGLYNNVILFPLTRGTNTTSLAHYLPGGVRAVYTAGFALVVLWALWRMARARFAPPAAMGYLLVAHMGVLAGSGILHNNYTIWFAPILALFTVELMLAGPPAATDAQPATG